MSSPPAKLGAPRWRNPGIAQIGNGAWSRIVPRGTHDWRLFIRPAELDRLLRRAGLEPVELCGLAPQIGPGIVARGLLTRRIDIPSFATGNGRRASYLGHYRKAVG